jgi:hypothetical protein
MEIVKPKPHNVVIFRLIDCVIAPLLSNVDTSIFVNATALASPCAPVIILFSR